jgi:hypothetical protein
MHYQLRQLVSDIGYTLTDTSRLNLSLRGIEAQLRVLMGAGGLTVDPLFWEPDGVADAGATAGSALEAVTQPRRAVADIDTELLAVRVLVQRLDAEPEQGAPQ